MLRATNWELIWVGLLLPLPIALAVAWLFWRRNEIVLGNVVGLAVLFAASLVFGGAEYAGALKFRYWCEETATPCRPTGSSDFLRISLFGFIALVQAMALYVISGARERRAERAHYDARWR